MSFCSSHHQPESTHPYTTTDHQRSMSSQASAASKQQRMWLAQMNPFQKPGLTPIPEPLSSSSPRPPVPLPQVPSLPPMSFGLPLLSQPQILLSNFDNSRCSKEASRGLSPPTQPTYPATILGVLIPVTSTQMTSRMLSHPAPFYPLAPSFLQGSQPPSPMLRMTSIQAYSTGISQYQAPSMQGSPLTKVPPWPPTVRSQLPSQNPSLVCPDLQGNKSSLKEQRLGGDQETIGQAVPNPQPPLQPRDSPLRNTSMEFPGEEVQNYPSPHHDTPP